MSLQLKAVDIAAPFMKDVKQEAVKITEQLGRKPLLLGILANADEPSRMYAKMSEKMCHEAGLDYRLKVIGSKEEPSQPADIEQAVLEANLDGTTDGIMIYFPIFTQNPQEDAYLQQVVSPSKDVEGLHFFFRFNLYHNIRWVEPSLMKSGERPKLGAAEDSTQEQPSRPGLVKAILPCTSLAIIKVLESIQVYHPLLPYGKRLFGKTITVINRSEVVGRPLAALLANDGSRVFSVDVNNIIEFNRRMPNSDGTKPPAWHPNHITSSCDLSLEACLQQSDVVISGVPSADYKVNTASLKDGVVAINFSSAKNFQDDIKEKASLYLPSVGKVTNAMLLRNLLRLASYRQMAPAVATDR